MGYLMPHQLPGAATDDEPSEDETFDLRPALGIAVAVTVSLPIWCLIAAAAWYLAR